MQTTNDLNLQQLVPLYLLKAFYQHCFQTFSNKKQSTIPLNSFLIQLLDNNKTERHDKSLSILKPKIHRHIFFYQNYCLLNYI